MTIEIKVPQLPESVSDATLVAWHKKAGDSVSRDENLVDLETDKVVLEVPAPASGTLSEIKIEDGATVTAGQVLAILTEGAGGETAAAAAEPAAAASDAAEATRVQRVGQRVAAQIEPCGSSVAGGARSGSDDCAGLRERRPHYQSGRDGLSQRT